MVLVNLRTLRTKWWCAVVIVLAAVMVQVTSLNGPNVCMVKQKYNITKRVKYRAPMSVRTYVWCFSVPPRCSTWKTEMRDLTRLETEERTAEVAVCCPGYKMKDVSCVPICPNGKTGPKCADGCPPNRWGPNCANECPRCNHGECSPLTGECQCHRGWQGESCDYRITTTTAATTVGEPLITHTSTKISSMPIITTVSTTETKTTTSTIGTSSALPSSTSTVPPTVTSTTMTVPMTTQKVTEAIETTSEKFKTSLQPTESYKISLSTSIVKAIEEVTTISPESTTDTNITEMVLPITPSIVLKVIPTVKTEVSTATTTKATEKIKEPDTPATTTKEIQTTMLPTTVTLTTIEPKTTEKEIMPIVPTSTPMIIKLSTRTELSAIINQTTKTTTEVSIKEPTIIPSSTETTKIETTKKPETTVRISTTAKFKPKEIWIKPAQKGEPIETKKITHDVLKHRVATNKDFTANTTPKTIIVSIIPTSVSYATFKKIALTTASFTAQKSNTTIKSYNKTSDGFTKPMSTQTFTTPATMKITASTATSPNQTKLDESFIKDLPFQTITTEEASSKIEINKTNSMTEKSYIQIKPTANYSTLTPVLQTTDKKSLLTTSTIASTTPAIIAYPTHKLITEYKNSSKISAQTTIKVSEKKHNHTKPLITYKVTTEDPADEETFHILTEPEHITAVMGEKEAGRSSIDLVSVISIAGGVMMAVITVAVVIVMIERCKRPRYEDVRKINDIRMQVMIDGSDAPPPYVRSIFHTPLPEPPMSEKCHYQPISTLDRNLKQFMRPVVVQTISPIMLENFRGILECHYDHLPRRSHDFIPMETVCSIAPSMSSRGELNHRQLIRDSTLESLKCEAKLDVIDTTTSEPLYAEIPSWRPPSEHAIEIMNLNGEAVTEL